MADIEKIIAQNIWKEFNILRGYLDIRLSQSICSELLFIKLINDALNNGNEYFAQRIKGQVNMNECEEDAHTFFYSLKEFIENNECLRELSFSIFQLEYENRDKLVCQIISTFNNIDTMTEEKPSVIFKEYINKVLVNSISGGVTSPSINKLISNLLKNINVNTLYDPAVGSGVLLADAAEGHEDVKLYGQDINKDMVSICRMLLILDERIEEVNNIAEGNTILSPAHREYDKLMKFDCIVGNPPLGLRDWGYNELINDVFNRFHRGIPPRTVADYAFISHVVESLSDKGTAIMVENSGVLFREGAEGVIRQKLVEENLIDAIIALPNNMLYGTAIPVNLIIFKKDKKYNDILFIDAAKEVQFNKVLTCLTDENIDDIVNIYNERVEVEGLSRRVLEAEIEDNDYNLMIGRYIEVNIEKEELDINELGKNIEELVLKLQETQGKINYILNKELN